MPDVDPRPSRGSRLARHLRVWLRDSSILYALLVASVSLNLVLALQIRQLRSPKTNVAVTGVTLEPFRVDDLRGEQQLLTFAGVTEPTVLYVMAPSCHWCARNYNNITMLAKLRKDSYRFIGLSVAVADLSTYVGSVNYGFPIYSIPSYEVVKGIPLGGTPQTIVISTRGTVIKNWIGAYSPEQQMEIESFFAVKLPGLLPDLNQRR